VPSFLVDSRDVKSYGPTPHCRGSHFCGPACVQTRALDSTYVWPSCVGIADAALKICASLRFAAFAVVVVTPALCVITRQARVSISLSEIGGLKRASPMLRATAFACDKAASDQPRDRDSKSIDGVAGCKCYNPYQQVEHGFHRAASHKQRARHPFPPYSQTPRPKRASSRRAATRTRKTRSRQNAKPGRRTVKGRGPKTTPPQQNAPPGRLTFPVDRRKAPGY
jgi:hypothetical protein